MPYVFDLWASVEICHELELSLVRKLPTKIAVGGGCLLLMTVHIAMRENHEYHHSSTLEHVEPGSPVSLQYLTTAVLQPMSGRHVLCLCAHELEFILHTTK